jgi:predicted ribosomally synthesized peptide with nif11-like leader
MSEEQLKAFWEAVQADTSLQEKLRAATDADSIASIAKEAGFEITADEVKEAQGELSEEQLKGVAGGFCGSARRIRILRLTARWLGYGESCRSAEEVKRSPEYKKLHSGEDLGEQGLWGLGDKCK